MIHQLKCEAQYFEAVVQGRKLFEVRKNDRGIRPGDFLALNALNEDGEETGLCVLLRINYILDDPRFVKEGTVIMGFLPCEIHMNDAGSRPALYGRFAQIEEQRMEEGRMTGG